MKTENSPLTLTSAIIIAGALIAVAIIWTQQRPVVSSSSAAAQAPQAAIPQISTAPISPTDHILGNPDAQVKIIEYSDPSCPYCKIFNPTMEQIISEYGPSGQVAWIYRQYPLDKPDASGNVLHPNSGTQAQALECAAGIGGNTIFWAYEKAWFDSFPQDGANETVAVDNAQIAAAGKSAGLDAVSFNDCITSGRYKARVDAEYTDGVNAGVNGTPYIVIVTPSGTKIPLAGAQSYATLKTTIDALVSGNQADPSAVDSGSTDQNPPDSSGQ